MNDKSFANRMFKDIKMGWTFYFAGKIFRRNGPFSAYLYPKKNDVWIFRTHDKVKIEVNQVDEELDACPYLPQRP